MFFLPPPGLATVVPRFQLRPIVDIRERYEHHVNADFNGAHPDNVANLVQRYRFGVRLSYEGWHGILEAQIAEGLTWTPAANSDLERRDLLLGNVSHALGIGDVTVGRQRLKIGNERLLGESNWNNISTSWDGVRWQARVLDLFAARLGISASPSRNAAVSGGAYNSRYGQTLYIFKHDDQNAVETDLHTLSQADSVVYGKWSAEGQAIGQLGRRNGRRVEAWAYYAKVAYQATPNWSLNVNTSVASGGTSGSVYRTFDTLYYSSHDNYGLLDAQGWRNTQLLGIGTRYRLRRDLELAGEFHNYGLRDGTDAWYATRGTNKGFIDPTGKSGRDVGQEYAAVVNWDWRKDFSVSAGAGIFHAGSFIRNLSKDTSDQTFFYLQTSYRF